MRIVDDDGKELPWDGRSSGDLHRAAGRGSSPATSRARAATRSVDGWFPTGDVATIDPDGFMQITDRSKDVIKSGGEWISSIDLENIAMAHPAVTMAACIAVPHPKWDERPLLVVVKKPGATVQRDELLAFFDGQVAKWQIPDDVVFVDSISATARPARCRRSSCASSSRATPAAVLNDSHAGLSPGATSPVGVVPRTRGRAASGTVSVPGCSASIEVGADRDGYRKDVLLSASIASALLALSGRGVRAEGGDRQDRAGSTRCRA